MQTCHLSDHIFEDHVVDQNETYLNKFERSDVVLICLTMCPINWKGRNQQSDVRDKLKINPKINCKGAELNGDSSQIINEAFQAAQVATQSQIDHKIL